MKAIWHDNCINLSIELAEIIEGENGVILHLPVELLKTVLRFTAL